MWNQYVDLVDGYKVITLAVLIIIDLVLGIVVAVKDGTFQFSKISNYLNKTYFKGWSGASPLESHKPHIGGT